MPEAGRFTGCSDWTGLGFVERKATPEPVMKLGVKLHLPGLTLPDAISVVAGPGVDWCHYTVHNWIQRTNPQAAERKDTSIDLDVTVIQANGQRYCLFAAVDLDTNRPFHVRLFLIKNSALTQVFLSKLR